ncbi:MAG: hypothetical protein PHW63_11635, partial [Alphaproteobacteria bacterium]|nr:hypothetical protein [Alphaproteobacteria bacterium]
RNLRNEELWTPQVIYDVVPPGELVRDGYGYSEGDDNFDATATENSLFDGVRDFFEKLFGALGTAISGIAQTGIGLVVQVFDGIVNLATSIGDMTGNVFQGLHNAILGGPDLPPEPLPDLFSPIAADLEAKSRPLFEKVDLALQNAEAAQTDAGTLNSQMESLIGNSEDAIIWTIQKDINTVNETINTNQTEAIEAQQEILEGMQEYVSRGMFLPDSTKVNSITNPHWTVTFEGNLRKMHAEGDWVGEFIYHSATHRRPTEESPSDDWTGYPPDFGQVIEGGAVTAAARDFWAEESTSAATLTYWIRPGTGGVWTGRSTPGGFSPAKDVWHRLDEFTFNQAADMPTRYEGPHVVTFIGEWDATSYEDWYGLQITKNGAMVDEIWRYHVGPRFPGGSGVRKQQLVLNPIELLPGDTLEFWIKASSPEVHERKLRSASLEITWTIPPADETDIVEEPTV